MHSFRFARLWLALGWVLIAIVVLLSVWPSPPGEVGVGPGGKLGHVIAYLVLMLWFANIYPHRHRRVWLSVAFFVMGVCLESFQGILPDRTFRYTDMLANGFGVLLGFFLAKTLLSTFLLHLDTWLAHVGQRAK